MIARVEANTATEAAEQEAISVTLDRLGGIECAAEACVLCDNYELLDERYAMAVIEFARDLRETFVRKQL